MVVPVVLGSLTATTIGPPVNYLRLRVGPDASAVAGRESDGVRVAVVAGLGRLVGAGVLGGALDVPALVLGEGNGTVAVDAFDARTWGSARAEG